MPGELEPIPMTGQTLGRHPIVGRLAVSLFMLASTLQAAEPRCRRILPVAVKDGDGKLVEGLAAPDFRAEVRGSPLSILSVETNSSPQRIVLLLDRSKSMSRHPEIRRLARAGVAHLVGHLGNRADYALVAFSDRAELKVSLGEGKEAVLQQLEFPSSVEANSTALFDAIALGALALESPRPEDIIYLISDGQNTYSKTSWDDVERALLERGVRLFVFHFREIGASRRNQVRLGWNKLRHLVQVSGGDTLAYRYHPRDPELTAEKESDLLRSLGLLYQQMQEFQHLEIQLPVELKKPRKWKLEAVDERGEKRKDLTVLYPRKLMPCAVLAGPK
jgi:hypothetical protein